MALSEAAIAAIIGGAASAAGAGINAAGTAIANKQSYKYSKSTSIIRIGIIRHIILLLCR